MPGKSCNLLEDCKIFRNPTTEAETRLDCKPGSQCRRYSADDHWLCSRSGYIYQQFLLRMQEARSGAVTMQWPSLQLNAPSVSNMVAENAGSTLKAGSTRSNGFKGVHGRKRYLRSVTNKLADIVT